MPITMCRGCKSTPAALLSYITGKPEVTRIEYRDIDEGRPLAKQFKDNHEFHGKGLGLGERKYYHLIVSWPTGSDITDDEMIDVSNKILDRFFQDHPAVTAIHDKEILDGVPSNRHTHSCIDSVSLEKGEMIHMSQKEYTALKDYANELGAEIGFESVDFREPKKFRVPKAEMRAIERDGTSWKADLRNIIVNSYNNTLDEYGTFADFIAKCEEQGVKLNGEGKWILQGHMPVGYSRLGEQCRPLRIFENLTENYLESVPEDLQEEAKDIEKKTPLWQKIMGAEKKSGTKESGKAKPKKQITPEQYEQIREYRAETDRFWKGYRRAQELAARELQKAYQSPENREAFRNYRKAQYLFKNSFGIITFTLGIINLGLAKQDLKREQERVNHIKDLRRELGQLCQEAISLKVALNEDTDERNRLAGELEAEIRAQQAAINERLQEITAELGGLEPEELTPEERERIRQAGDETYRKNREMAKIINEDARRRRAEAEKAEKHDARTGDDGER